MEQCNGLTGVWTRTRIGGARSNGRVWEGGGVLGGRRAVEAAEMSHEDTRKVPACHMRK